MARKLHSLEYTPAWVVALVCSVIVLISLFAERGLHLLGKCLQRKNQKALFRALEKLKEELMLLGFISLLLTVFQGTVSRICIPSHLVSSMVPCKMEEASSSTTPQSNHYEQISNQTVLNAPHTSDTGDELKHCAREGKVPLLSTEALHELHIFIFVLALVHVIFCATTMVLGIAKMRQWKHWENQIMGDGNAHASHHHHHRIFKLRAGKFWRKAAVVGWIIAFFKQFYGSVTKHDYVALRHGFIQEHCPRVPKFDFHGYMLRTLEIDFRSIVGISSYLWLFLVVSLLLDINGWHAYFWLAFLPLIFLLLVGAKLEHIITRLAKEVGERTAEHEGGIGRVKPSDEHFWLRRPNVVLYLIRFILFENSFEIAFFFWIWTTYGFNSCIMDKKYVIPRLIIGAIIQVSCSYSTFPLYALVTQMGGRFKSGMFEEYLEDLFKTWAKDSRKKRKKNPTSPSSPHQAPAITSAQVHIEDV